MTLQDALKRIETNFTVSAEVLKEISQGFYDEMELGLTQTGNAIPMNVTWVTEKPTGNEQGEYLSIDLGGTNMRVVLVTLKGDSKFDSVQSKYNLPAWIKTGTANELWSFIAEYLEEFLLKQYQNIPEETLPLGFSFSFATTQGNINEGVLQSWSKGFDVKGVEGHDVVPMLQKAIDKRSLPVKITALINDTTGTLVASLYTDPLTKMGLIFGTGVNGAYYDTTDQIPKLGISQSSPMAINTEYGSFDSSHRYLPRTFFDVAIDNSSTRPGEQTYEKMVAGYYMGELLRLLLVDLYYRRYIFQGQDVSQLNVPYIMDTSYLASAEQDSDDLPTIGSMFESLGLATTLKERQLIQTLSKLIATRAARLAACSIAAICKRTNVDSGNIACDGSVISKYPFFKERIENALAEILDWSERPYPLQIVQAEDGSSVGAAIIACIAQKSI